jgi:hypothetical protein
VWEDLDRLVLYSFVEAVAGPPAMAVVMADVRFLVEVQMVLQMLPMVLLAEIMAGAEQGGEVQTW